MSSRTASTVGLVSLALLLRLAAFQLFPNFETLDSPDYLVAARQLAEGSGLDAPRIGSWRAPGYPVFLAFVRLVADHGARTLLFAQALGGLVTVAAAAWLGRQLAGRAGSYLGAALCAAHPAYLLFEHMVHPEALTLCLLVVGSGVAVSASLARRPSGFFVAGLVFGASALVRPNVLPFDAVLLLGLAFFPRPPEPFSRRSSLLAAGAAALGFALLVGPWLWRQERTFGRASLTLNVQRNQLIYLSQHGMFTPEARPLLPGHTDPLFSLVASWGEDPVPAEARARALFERATADRAGLLLRKRLRAAATFAGIPNYDPPAAGRHDVRFWLRTFVQRPGQLTLHRRALRLPHTLLRNRLPTERATFGNDLWAGLGDFTLRYARPAALATALAALAWSLRQRTRWTSEEGIATIFLAAIFAAAAVHGWFLADYDRFAVVFDWVLPLCAATFLSSSLARWRGER